MVSAPRKGFSIPLSLSLCLLRPSSLVEHPLLLGVLKQCCHPSTRAPPNLIHKAQAPPELRSSP